MAAVKMSGRIYDEDEDDREDLDELEETDDEQLDDEGDDGLGDEDSQDDDERDCSDDVCEIADPATGRVKSIVDVILSDLADAEAECAEAERKVTRCKADLRAAKGEYDAAVEALRSLCKSARDDESKPLMPAFRAADEKAASEGEVTSEDHWEDAEVGDLAIPDGLVEKLAEAGIETIKDLEDLRAQISQGKAKWPKGIGQAKITVIEDAVLQWFAVNQK